jgi:hypothetical protein
MRGCRVATDGPHNIVSRQIENVAREIMSYFLNSSEATDTLEGIARWRLMQQRIDRTVDQTFSALRLLVDRGLIEEVRSGTGPVLFRLNASRRAEAESSFGEKQ